MKFGLTQSFACSYLPEEHEQLLVYAEADQDLRYRYGQLIQAGFRRSGEQIYRPHCPACDACQSIRIPVNEFTPSRSQRRLLNKNASLNTKFSDSPKDSYYPLYEKYIVARHSDGSMFPPSQEQFQGFIHCSWSQPVFLEAYQDDQLVAVAVTDDIFLSDGNLSFSAFYTFFEPDLADRSMGTWMILQQLAFAAKLNRAHLYLGYQIDNCNKMNYKSNFYPHERLFDNKWQKISSK